MKKGVEGDENSRLLSSGPIDVSYSRNSTGRSRPGYKRVLILTSIHASGTSHISPYSVGLRTVPVFLALTKC
jgi:hypothetical protein